MSYTIEQVRDWADGADVVLDDATGLAVAVSIDQGLFDKHLDAIDQAVSDMGDAFQAIDAIEAASVRVPSQDGKIWVSLDHCSDTGIDGGWCQMISVEFAPDEREYAYNCLYDVIRIECPEDEGDGDVTVKIAMWNTLVELVQSPIAKKI